MARLAIGAKIGHVLRHKIRLIFAVARFASRRIKLRHIVAVASGARKRLPVRLFLMRGQRELQTVVGKILGRDLRQRRGRAVVFTVTRPALIDLRESSVQRLGIGQLRANIGATVLEAQSEGNFVQSNFVAMALGRLLNSLPNAFKTCPT